MVEPLEKPTDSNSLSRTVRLLGFISLCTDLASEMVYPLTPSFLTRVLGAPAWTVGIVEGVAESTASLLKFYSGWLSDRVGQRKPFAVAGYGLGAIAKPLIALSGVWVQVLGARFLDRVGKGLRAAPRDALIAENCSAKQRGRAFGFHRSMDTTGALLGPLLGFWFLQQYPGQVRWLYGIAFLPALLGVVILTLLVKEPKARANAPQSSPQFTLHGLSPSYRRYLLIIGLFSLGNSSDAFLLLRSQDLGITTEQMLLLYAVFNVMEAFFGMSAGNLSDRVGRRPLLVAGYLVFALVYLGFATAQSASVVWVLFAFYGLYSTLTQGVQKAFVADLVHPEQRGAEIGTFYMLVGFAALPASLIAGWLYTNVSVAAPFYFGAIAAMLSALLLTSSKLLTNL
ncbi:MAG: MFS transporter [Hydrococcus sp. RU_2_2]|nr:MFS transporter [Hydrococcus sp. RU_2_2]NJP19004.1 MFS transporter [Hydrococcus sp. CRU_1_1]NJQ98741.1 MFS transporter [Hydrococcus sp. CSU_1_8]